MADDAKAKPTPPERPSTMESAPPTEPDVLPHTMPGTMQMAAGAKLGEPPALLATVVPTTGGGATAGPPPPLPSNWRYDLGKEIARGGMGRVVEATDTVLGRTVALKEALALDTESVRRFQRETRITAKLEHPSIVPVHDAGTAPNGSPFYVMRKVTGRPLEELVGRADTLEKRLALVPNIVAAAHAIAHAHERGVVHRDIKPSNILVGDNGETVVIDWGLAKVIGETEDSRGWTAPVTDDDSLKTRVGIVFGTPGFMAPEQLRGAPVDQQCDVYALGATLYHLLARKPPHHAANGEVMMKAAVAGPPEPLRAVVAGVPPELATIVDKALAFDPHDRYKDARAVAEDLNRFLTGQLVASHHYSPRERLARWVRRNRALVSVSGAALAVMIVGGALAIARIVNERDRADDEARRATAEKLIAERERAAATDRANELALAGALSQAETNPTRAVAMVKPLAETAKWRKVRAIAAKARAAGVAFALPASAKTTSLELGHDGHWLLAAGSDGTVRLYDLAKRASELEVHVATAATARLAGGDRRVVIAHEATLTIVEIATRARRDVATPSTIVELAVAGSIAYWTDVAGAVWTLDLETEAIAKLPIDEAVHAIAPSPEGRWIALAGAAHLLLLDRSQPTMPAEAPVDGSPRALAWSSDASHLAALIGEEVFDVHMAPTPEVVHRLTVGARRAVAYANRAVYTSGPMGIAIVRDASRGRTQVGDFTLGLREARRGVVIAGGAQSVHVLADDVGDVTLRSPIVPLQRVEATPASSIVVAAVESHVLVWNLDDVLPVKLSPGTHATSAAFVDRDHVIATYGDSPAQWIDVRTGTQTALRPLASLREVVAAPDGHGAIAIDVGRAARLVGPERADLDIGDDVVSARFVDDHRYVVVTSAGDVRLDDGAQHRVLHSAHAKPTVLAARGTRVAAAFVDGSVWRGDVAGAGAGAGQRLAIGAAADALAIAPDGTTVIAIGGELRGWRGDGSVHVHATLPRAIVTLALVDAHALAIIDDGSAYAIGLGDKRDQVPAPAAAEHASVSDVDGLVVATTAAGGLDAIDALANVRWPLRAPHDARFGVVQMSRDGGRALALGSAGLFVWTLALPAQANIATWLAATTNAVDDDPSKPLAWP